MLLPGLKLRLRLSLGVDINVEVYILLDGRANGCLSRSGCLLRCRDAKIVEVAERIVVEMEIKKIKKRPGKLSCAEGE